MVIWKTRRQTVCFTDTVCHYNVNYHRTPLQYITQNKLIQKVHSLTGQITSSEEHTETNTELLLSCKERGNSKRIPQIMPTQVTQAAVLLIAPSRADRAGQGEQQRALGEASQSPSVVLGNSQCVLQLWSAALLTPWLRHSRAHNAG